MKIINNIIVIFILLIGVTITRIYAEDSVEDLYNKERWGVVSMNGKYHGGGACTLDPAPSGVEGHYPVAISGGMFQNSDFCGMCFQLMSSGLSDARIKNHTQREEMKKDSGFISNKNIKYANNNNNNNNNNENENENDSDDQIIVYVADICPSCAWGEMGVYANGDYSGRLDVEWKAVPCPTGNSTLEYMFLDSDAFFIKVQVRNSPKPIESLKIWDHGSNGFRKAWRSKDNFFQTTLEEPARYPLRVKLQDILGEEIEDRIPFQGTNYHVVPGKNQFSGAKTLFSTQEIVRKSLVVIVLSFIFSFALY